MSRAEKQPRKNRAKNLDILRANLGKMLGEEKLNQKINPHKQLQTRKTDFKDWLLAIDSL
jgi:hypothetical protein